MSSNNIQVIENRKAKKNLKNNLMYPIGQSPKIVGLAPTNFHNNVRKIL